MLLLTLMLLAQSSSAAARIGDAVSDGIRAGAFPGAVVVVGSGVSVLHAEGYGRLTWSAASAVPDPESTLYDLASLTKVVAATPVAMRLVDDGRLDLGAPVQRYLPGFTGAGKDRVTVRHLLEHRSGLRAFLPLNDLAATAEQAKQLVLTEPLRWPVASRVEYSDLNAMLLGWIVEAASGQSLDAVADATVFGPVGMSQTRFLPPRTVRERLAPVGLWRGQAIAGEVHDQNAARLNGVSGHAGLYSTGLDLARYAQVLLRRGHGVNGEVVFEPSTVEEFTRRGLGGRALGWESRDTSAAQKHGRLMSQRAYGHGGFTGTSLWIDPEHDLFVVVLTNRVFAPKTRRSISRLRGVRAEIADAAVALRGEACAAVVVAARQPGC